MSGAITTEYPAHEIVVPTASASPPTLLEKPPLPAATKPTPMKAAAAATQKPVDRRSIPKSEAIRPVKIGSAPRISATVDADVSCTEITKQSWLRKMSRPPSATSRTSLRAIRNERSRRQVKHKKSAVAAP